MTSPFAFRPSAVVAGIEVLPKDSYHFEVGEPKSFSRISKDPAKEGAANAGVMYPLKVVSEGPKKGKTIYYNCWLHTEGGQKITKSFLMAVLGFSMKQQGDYDAKYDAADWSCDFDNKTCGAAWHEATGKVVSCDLDVKMSEQNEEQQNFGFWRVYGAK